MEIKKELYGLRCLKYKPFKNYKMSMNYHLHNFMATISCIDDGNLIRVEIRDASNYYEGIGKDFACTKKGYDRALSWMFSALEIHLLQNEN